MVITRTDPEFAKLFENFAGSEVVGEVSRHCPRRRGTLQFLQYLSAAGARTLTAKCCLRQLTAA